MYDDIVYDIALRRVPGIGNILAKNLCNKFGSSKNVFDKSLNSNDVVNTIGEKLARTIKRYSDFDSAKNELDKSIANDIKIINYTSDAYPSLLKNARDCPFILYHEGNIDLNSSRFVCMVGTRKSTSYGRDFIKSFIRDLAPYRETITIVSGLAIGVDSRVHKEALENSIPTIAVLGQGLRSNIGSWAVDLFKDIRKDGSILTEYELEVDPEPSYFPARNRIMAGMCEVTVVVESYVKGGALITANLANDYQRDVFALPGDFRRLSSQGCNKLIQNNKAHLITCAKDMIDLMNWIPVIESNNSVKKNTIPKISLSSSEELIINKLEFDPTHIDTIAYNTKLSPFKVSSILLELELKGLVESLPGKMYKLIH